MSVSTCTHVISRIKPGIVGIVRMVLTAPGFEDRTSEAAALARRISGLQAEMSEMEMSLDQLRQEFEAQKSHHSMCHGCKQWLLSM